MKIKMHATDIEVSPELAVLVGELDGGLVSVTDLVFRAHDLGYHVTAITQGDVTFTQEFAVDGGKFIMLSYEYARS